MTDLEKITKSEANKEFFEDVKSGIAVTGFYSLATGFLFGIGPGYMLDGIMMSNEINFSTSWGVYTLGASFAFGYLAYKEGKEIHDKIRRYIKDPHEYVLNEFEEELISLT